MMLLLAMGGAYAVSSLDFCRLPRGQEPRVVARATAAEPWQVGAASVALDVPWPVTVAGYAPWRSVASSSDGPLLAQAIVVASGALRVALVTLDVLLVPPNLVEDVKKGTGLEHVIVAATHTHSSLGGYDPRWTSALAGTGRFRSESAQALTEGSKQAITQALAALRPASAQVLPFDMGGLNRARSGDAVDTRALRVRFRAETDATIAELWLLSAHPTLVPRRTATLSGDYPAALAQAVKATTGASAVLVIQSLGGNASTAREYSDAKAFADAVLARGSRLAEWQPVASHPLSVVTVRLPLSPPDATRLVPRLFARPSENLLCQGQPDAAPVTAVSFGTLRFVAVPFELSFAAGLKLEEAAEARALSNAQGYFGYLESRAAVQQRSGEGRRQYFAENFVDTVTAAVALTAPEAPRR